MNQSTLDNPENPARKTLRSRRWLLKRTVSITAGTVAVSAIGNIEAEAEKKIAADGTPHANLETGEIFDRERHHRWDTI
jgi:hypothetical protein